MTKNLLYFFIFLFGISLYESKDFTNGIADTYTVPTNVTAFNITFTSAQISWDPIPSNQYIVEFRQVGAAWMSFSVGSITTFGLVTLQPCTAYEVRIRDAVNINDVSESIFFVTNYDYCAASSSSQGTYISNVTVTPSGGGSPINNTSVASNYSNFYNSSSLQIQLAQGSTNNILSVSKAWSGAQSAAAVSAWIDFNGNGTFESMERIMNAASSLASPATVNFTVPSGSMSGGNCGSTLRVIVSSGSISSPCGTFAVGEVEDYKVIFVNGTLSAGEIQKNQGIIVYPNPVSDILHISGVSSATDFEIYNAVGQKVNEGRVSDKINVRHLVKGTYFIQIKDKKLKFIKK